MIISRNNEAPVGTMKASLGQCIALALTVWLLTSHSTLAGSTPARHILIRVTVDRASAVQEIVDMGLDVLGVAPDRASMTIRVSNQELAEIRRRGFIPTIIESDVYAHTEQVAEPVTTGAWAQYHDLDSTNQELLDLAAAYPDLAAPFTIGTSWEGRSINGLRISDNAAIVNDSEPAFFIIGCHHAREWISVEVPLYIATQLLSDYDTDPDVRALVDRGEIWIVPVLNVDGYVYTQFDRWWRGNRRLNDNFTYGVDLNRNYPYAWGGPGASPIPGDETYHGPAPLSEPETQAVSDLFAARRFTGALTYHNYSQFVATPWGYTEEAPPHATVLSSLARDMVSAINASYADPRYTYVAGQWSTLLYLGSGVFADWAYGEHGVASILVELRPEGSPYFKLPADQILPTCIENYAGALHMMTAVFGPESEVSGDFNADGTIDLSDFSFFAQCISGPSAFIPGFPLGCTAADVDGDGKTTIADANRLLLGFGKTR